MPTQAVYQAIQAVMADLSKEGIAKTSKNQQQGYAFRGIDAVLNTLSPMLAKHGLIILPRMLERAVVERETKNGGALFSVTVTAEFDFVAVADGSRHVVRTYGEAMDSADKATNKAMSAAYKYAAFQTFCIPTEGEDADATTPDVAGRPQVARAQPVKVTAPAGYRDWLDDLTGTVDAGTPALEKAWKASKPEFRKHLTATEPAMWEAMKARAAALTNDATWEAMKARAAALAKEIPA